MTAGARRVVAALNAGAGAETVSVARARPVLDTAVVLGRLLRAEPAALVAGERTPADVRALADDRGIPLEISNGDPVDVFVRALGDSSAVAGVMPAGASTGDDAAGHASREVVERADRPVAVVPARARVTALRRFVVAIDGSEQTRYAIARFAGLLQDATPEIVVVHVFDDRTTPAFLDRPERDLAVWRREFLERRCPWPGARLRLATGPAGPAIAEAAVAEQADGIVVGWWQDQQRAWATATRDLLVQATVPVLLLPVVLLTLNDHQRQGRPV